MIFSFLIWSLLLQAEQTSQKRSWRLLLLLPKRGPRAFSSFCSALRETEQQHLCDLLTQSPEKDGKETHVEVSVHIVKHHHTHDSKATVYTALVQFLDCFLLVEYSAWGRARGRGRATSHADNRKEERGEQSAYNTSTRITAVIVTVDRAKTNVLCVIV